MCKMSAISTWRMFMVPDQVLGGWGHLKKNMDHHDTWFFTCVPNFSSLAWLEVCQEALSLKSILGGCWWFQTKNLEGGVLLDIMYDYNCVRQTHRHTDMVGSRDACASKNLFRIASLFTNLVWHIWQHFLFSSRPRVRGGRYRTSRR